MPNFERIYALHQCLRSRRHPASTDELMAELECSRSTLQRTLAEMRDFLGAPILNVPGRGYFYDRTAEKFELPGLWFRRDELEALLVMEHLLGSVQPGLLSLHINPLRDKLKAILDAGVKGRLPFPSHRIRILRTHARTVRAAQFGPAATAIVERRQLTFSYAGRAAGTTKQRTASPQRLVYYRDQWYLDAWDEDKDALRTFAIDRMEEAEVLDQSAREVEEAELDAALTSGYGLFAGPAKQRARLVFTPERARWVADELWHPDQSGRHLADGHYELTVPYADPRELLGEVLRYGDGVKVVGPQSLIDLVRARLDGARAQYGDRFELVPKKEIGEMRGFLAGMDPQFEREGDREL